MSVTGRIGKGEATRERLLDSAARLFAEQGFDATSVESIAGSIGLAVSGLYRHFATKDDLLLEVARRANRSASQRRRLTGTDPLPEQMAELFAGYLDVGESQLRRLSIELSRAAVNNDELRAGLSGYNERVRRGLEATVVTAHPEWADHPEETSLVSHLLMVLLMGAVHLDTLDADRIGDPRLIEYLHGRFSAVFATTSGIDTAASQHQPPPSASREIEEVEPADGRRARTVRTRRRILAAAGELFAEYGYDGTTTDMIAERAEITVPGLYRHVDSKETLLADVGRHAFDRYRIAGPIGGSGDVTTDLADLVSAFSQPSDRVGRRLAVELDFGAWRSEVLAGLLHDFHRQVRANVARSLLDDGVHDDPEDADLAAMVFLMLFMGIGHLDTIDPGLVGGDAWIGFLRRRVPQLVG